MSKVSFATGWHRIEYSVTSCEESVIVPKSATAATTLSSFVRMPLSEHGSRKAIEHWRGFRGSPLEQNQKRPTWASVLRKVTRCQEEMRIRTQERTEDSWRVCRSFDGRLPALIWGANGTGSVLRRWMEAVGK